MKEALLNFGVNDIAIDGKSLYDIAFWNEFGTEFIPPRPALQMGLDIAIRKHKKLIQAYVLNYATAMRMNDRQKVKSMMQKRKRLMFSQIGRTAVKEAKNIIKSGQTVGNAPATIKKKGFDHPLYVDGTYHDNVNYEVVG